MRKIGEIEHAIGKVREQLPFIHAFSYKTKKNPFCSFYIMQFKFNSEVKNKF